MFPTLVGLVTQECSHSRSCGASKICRLWVKKPQLIWQNMDKQTQGSIWWGYKWKTRYVYIGDPGRLWYKVLRNSLENQSSYCHAIFLKWCWKTRWRLIELSGKYVGHRCLTRICQQFTDARTCRYIKSGIESVWTIQIDGKTSAFFPVVAVCIQHHTSQNHSNHPEQCKERKQ